MSDNKALVERIRMNAQMCMNATRPPVSDLMQLVAPIALLAEDAMAAAAIVSQSDAALAETKAELAKAHEALSDWHAGCAMNGVCRMTEIMRRNDSFESKESGT